MLGAVAYQGAAIPGLLSDMYAAALVHRGNHADPTARQLDCTATDQSERAGDRGGDAGRDGCRGHLRIHHPHARGGPIARHRRTQELVQGRCF